MAKINCEAIGMVHTGVKMPPDLIERIDRFARSLGQGRAETIRQLLQRHVPALPPAIEPEPRRPPWA